MGPKAPGTGEPPLRVLTAVRSALGPHQYSAAWATGHALGTARAVAETLEAHVDSPAR